MHDFDLVRPATVGDAVKAHADAEDPRYLAGGQSLIPLLKHRLAAPSTVIDLGALPGLGSITQEHGAVRIGALVCHADVARSRTVRAVLPGLADLAGGIGDAQVRNRGTIGGSLAHVDPAADYPAALLALGGTVVTDRRRIAADDFIVDLFETALEEGEIITAVEFPIAERAAYGKLGSQASRYAVAGVMVARRGDAVRVAVTGAGAHAFRVPQMEQALAARFSPEALDGITLEAGRCTGDLHATAEYRAHLVGVLARRVVGVIQD